MNIPVVRTRTGACMPVLGQGTWRMGEDPDRRKEEVDALRLGLDLGMSLIDTAEMYADGESESVVAAAIRGRRNEAFVVSKVLPQNASREGTVRAAERSLSRLGTDRIDLYLLHWPGRHPLEETLEAFERLERDGKILHHGVSNFDVEELAFAEGLASGGRVAADQVLYNLKRRGVERGLSSWCASRNIAIMAYSPLEQGALVRDRALREVAARHEAPASAVALAWVLRHSGVVTIPKAASRAHVADNARALEISLTDEDLVELDRAHPPPEDGGPLEML